MHVASRRRAAASKRAVPTPSRGGARQKGDSRHSLTGVGGAWLGRPLAWLLVSLLAIVLSTTACTTAKKKKLEANYGPSESIIEVVAVLRRHVPDDTYRFPPATDFTGRNVYRSSLLRLESIERIHADLLRSGYMDPVIEFAKGRALERLRGYDLAAQHYREAARFEGELKNPALRSAHISDRISEAISVGIDLEDPMRSGDGGQKPLPQDTATVIAELEERVALLSLLLDEVTESHYGPVVREEIERADEVRARYFVDMRFVIEDGHLRAAAELQRVISRHGPSKRRLDHLLALANLYDALAHEYVAALPPESMQFDPARFQDLVDPATQLYEAVATQDGTPQKLEASRRLEALLAFTLKIDSDRFSQ